MKLYENLELRKEITKKNLMSMPTIHGQVPTEEIINSEVDKLMNNTRLLNLHKKALTLAEKMDKQHKTSEAIDEEIKNVLGHSIEKNGFDRLIYINMDISGTPEAHKKNRDYILSLQDKDFAAKEFGKIINKIREFDFSKTVFETPEEALDLFEKNYEMLSYMFVFTDCLTNGQLDFGEKGNAFLAENTSLIQQGGYYGNIFSYYKSNVCLTVPEDTPLENLAALPKIGKIIGKYSDVLDNVDVVGTGIDDNTGKALSSRLLIDSIFETKIKNQPELFEKGIIPKNPLNYVAVKDNKEISASDGIDELISGNNNITFRKRSMEELKELDNIFTNPQKQLSRTEPGAPKTLVTKHANFYIKEFENAPKKYTLMENAFNDLSKLQKVLADANHFYSKNHEEYNNLMAGLNSFLSKDASQYSEKEFKTNVKNVEKLALDYIEAKSDQTKNSTRQTRFDACKDIYKITNKFETSMNELNRIPMEPIQIEDVIDDFDNSFEIENDLVNELDKNIINTLE